MEAKTKASNFRPANKRMLVKQDVEEKTMVVLPKDIVQTMKPNVGTVISVANDCTGVKAGDRILFFPKAGMQLILDGQGFTLMHEVEILGFDE